MTTPPISLFSVQVVCTRYIKPPLELAYEVNGRTSTEGFTIRGIRKFYSVRLLLAAPGGTEGARRVISHSDVTPGDGTDGARENGAHATRIPPKSTAHKSLKMPANNVPTAVAAAAAVLLLFSAVIQGDPFVLMWKKAMDDRLRSRGALEAQRVRGPRHRVERPHRGRPPYAQFRFDIEDHDDSWCYEHLRFSKAQIIEMTELFGLHQFIKYRKGYRPAPETALCVVLRRLSYPLRYKDTCDVSNIRIKFLFLLIS
jgi:hypothetical protein